MSDLKSTLKFIRSEADMDDLELIRAEYIKRERALRNMRASEVSSQLEVGKKVRLSTNVKPKYLGNQICEVVRLDGAKAGLKLPRPMGKFKSGTLTAPITLIAEVL